MSSKKPAHAESAEKAEKPDPATPPPKDLDELPLNQGQVHPEPDPQTAEWNRQWNQGQPKAAKARIHMDQIDAVATPQGVVLFALTENGEIWQLTTFSGQPEWTHILTPEAPPEEL